MKGSSTLCSALARGSRLNVWNTNPISLLRIRASSSSDKSLTFWLLSQYSPAVGVSRQPIRFMSVDLPDPGAHDRHELVALDLDVHAAQRVHHLAPHVVVARQLVREDHDVGQRRVARTERGQLDARHSVCPTIASSCARAMR